MFKSNMTIKSRCSPEKRLVNTVTLTSFDARPKAFQAESDTTLT